MHAHTPPSPADIRKRFAEQRAAGGARHRDIADTLGISEAQLIAAHSVEAEVWVGDWPGLRARRLRAEWPAIIESLEPLGEVMALTRNASCVHEKTGVYRKASHNAHVGLVLGGEIDLRVFYQKWESGFAVQERTDKGLQQSLQFFDAQGVAIHKIFLRPASYELAWQQLVSRYAIDKVEATLPVAARAAAVVEKPDGEIDLAGFRAAWAALQDTHHFFGLLREYGLTRTQALRLAEPRFAQQVELSAAHVLLSAAARSAVPIMVFVGNPGMIQIHSGVVKRIAVMGDWLNVLDEGFNLHLRQDHIAQAWVVKKPTADGEVSSLELFDAQGESIAMFFGERKPGQPELASWRAILADLSSESVSCAA
ncbi:hemin-degrading factor [Uliginosibacterium sediminicola]|uniref:ChuX/HutX family heme-like substrate-binding protein n=1 Tax=Uliginosibacterium sediminicola TaxID=2024550 RepID=A0ABU9Z3G3_9RHOO